MADPFVAEIRMFPFNFAPRGWAFCDGQLLPLAQNTALFALLGTTYGGNGMSNFALPNLRDRTPMHPGQGNGLSLHDLGEAGGEASVTLGTAEIPAHTHALRHAGTAATVAAPGPSVSFGSTGVAQVYASGGTLAPMAAGALLPAGSGLPHENRQPYLTFNFCIALQGVFPQRW
ncbi:phage tail protein [Massilia atriviolacea]|uniref:Phage tail protein n=1 Tax=Massilia atriviolacea TaxID=2495579 RepID=A0A430HNS3_9BURK|nr:tail fiber protein [Massilia atriviolacea]RSZ59197.1 phage tail protein [Massilia atriviolacea]